MARDGRADTRTGWVYRSDAEPAVVQPLPRDPAAPAPAYTAPARVEARFIAPRPRRARGWMEIGFYAMTLPMAIGVGVMMAPVIAPMFWMFGTRSRP